MSKNQQKTKFNYQIIKFNSKKQKKIQTFHSIKLQRTTDKYLSIAFTFPASCCLNSNIQKSKTN